MRTAEARLIGEQNAKLRKQLQPRAGAGKPAPKAAAAGRAMGKANAAAAAAGKAATAKAAASPAAAAPTAMDVLTRGDDTSSSSDSSSSSSSSDDSSDSGSSGPVKGSGGQRVTRSRLRKGRKAKEDSGSGSDDDDEEVSSAVRRTGKGRLLGGKGKGGRKTSRHRKSSDSSSESSSDSSSSGSSSGGEGAGDKARGGAKRAGGGGDDDRDSGLDTDEFEDEFTGSRSASSSAQPQPSGVAAAATSSAAGAAAASSSAAIGTASSSSSSSVAPADYHREVTVSEMVNLLQMRRYQACRHLSQPYFKEFVVGTYPPRVLKGSGKVIFWLCAIYLLFPAADNICLCACLIICLCFRARAGTYVRVQQPPAPPEPGRRFNPAQKMQYRVARVHKVALTPHFYHPTVTGDPTEDVPEWTNVQLQIAFGSNASTENSVTKQAIPRVVKVCELSNSHITAEEFAAYKDRLKRQYDEEKNPLDRLPTIAEAKQLHARSQELISNSTNDATAVQKSLIHADFFLDSKLRNVPNLASVRDKAVARIFTARTEKPVLEAAAAAAPEGDARRKAQAAVRENAREIERLSKRLDKVAAEEKRRREMMHKADEARQKSGKNVSSLTHIINAKAEVANRKMMEEISQELRIKSAADFDADIDDNPYLRRRTAPKNLWSVPVAEGAAEGGGGAAQSADAASASSSSSSAAVAATSASMMDDAVAPTAPPTAALSRVSLREESNGAAAAGAAARASSLSSAPRSTPLSSSTSSSSGGGGSGLSSSFASALPAASTTAGAAPVKRGLSLSEYKARKTASALAVPEPTINVPLEPDAAPQSEATAPAAAAATTETSAIDTSTTDVATAAAAAAATTSDTSAIATSTIDATAATTDAAVAVDYAAATAEPSASLSPRIFSTVDEVSSSAAGDAALLSSSDML